MITTGQILPDHPLGQFLTEQARTATTIVEIGTGSGLGSTRCLAEGMKPHGESVLFTYEADRQQLEVAGPNIRSLLEGGKRIFLEYGVLHRGILPYFHPIESPQARECWEHEHKLAKHAPMEEMEIGDIDLLFLDGGEYTSFGDWLLLWHMAKVIVIDDCNARHAVKNAVPFHLMLGSPSFEPIRIHLHDRNGWAAFKRTTKP